jgi:diguanylate cyclase (GGDEF)-like protein
MGFQFRCIQFLEEFCVQVTLMILVQPIENIRGKHESLVQLNGTWLEGGFHRVPIEEGCGACGTAAFRKERVITPDVLNHPYWRAFREETQQAVIASCWSEPITDPNNKIIGTFTITHSTIKSPSKEDITVIEKAAHLVAIAIERFKADQMIQQQANYDPLTGLPNRNMLREKFDQELRIAQRQQCQIALLFLDLDHFKDINDTLGHDQGDELLKQVARRLEENTRKTDIVARLGGDEFTVVMGRIKNNRNVNRVAEQILLALSKPFQLET